jgi:hypothetical protein
MAAQQQEQQVDYEELERRDEAEREARHARVNAKLEGRTPIVVEWEEAAGGGWAMSGDNMSHTKSDGQGTEENPWHCVEKAPPSQGDIPASEREIGIEYMRYDDVSGPFTGMVVQLPEGYAGKLKLEDIVIFDACHIND